MKALISQRHEKGTCVWCEKEKECITVEFSDGFLSKNEICWRCLQKAVKVRSQQNADQKPSSENSGRQRSPPGTASEA